MCFLIVFTSFTLWLRVYSRINIKEEPDEKDHGNGDDGCVGYGVVAGVKATQ